MKLTLPASLRVTDEDAMEYIKQTILFEYRVADNGTEKMTDKKMKRATPPSSTTRARLTARSSPAVPTGTIRLPMS